ncbi:DNA helicase [Trifolium repens]|nr:DNA helicase [Trifolium repens]WJX81265.1 DNA helicase [Trifolium repens]
MEFSQSKIARFNRKQKIRKANHNTSTMSNTENQIPKEACMNQNQNMDIDVFKRKANRVPLSPLSQGSILTSNSNEDTNVSIPSKRIRIPNRKYFSPLPFEINSSNYGTTPSSNLTQPSQYHKGSSSSHSQVLNQRLNTKNKKESRKFPLQNKYIGVRRLEFEDDTDGHSIELNNLDDFKSTLYSCSEKEGFVNFGQPEFTSGTTPKFAQLYIVDTQHEVENRASVFRSEVSNKKDVIDITLVKDLKDMIDNFNPLAKGFRKKKSTETSRITNI